MRKPDWDPVEIVIGTIAILYISAGIGMLITALTSR